MSQPGEPGYDEMLEHQTGTEVPDGEEEVDPFDQEILDLGAPPGPGASANQADAYNFRVHEIEQRRAQEAAQEAEDRAENPEDYDDAELVTEPTWIDAHTNEVKQGDEIVAPGPTNPDGDDDSLVSADDGTGTAPGT